MTATDILPVVKCSIVDQSWCAGLSSFFCELATLLGPLAARQQIPRFARNDKRAPAGETCRYREGAAAERASARRMPRVRLKSSAMAA